MPNEVVIVVKAKNDTKAVFAAIRKEARDLGDNMGVDVTQSFTTRINRDATNTAGAYGKIGDTIGDTVGKRVAERITERIKVDVNERLRNSAGSSSDTTNNSSRDRTTINNGGSNDNDRERVTVHVDVDKKSLLERFSGAVDSMEERLRSGLSGALSQVFSGDTITLLVKGALVASLAGILGPVLGAAISAAVLTAFTGGAIAVGIVSALRDPRIQAAIGDLKGMLGGIFDNFGTYFKGPLEDFFEDMAGVLKQITPMVDSLGQSLGPIAAALGDGLIGLLQNLLPSVIRMVEAGEPLIKTLADELPGIGDALASLFDDISASGPDANQFWNDFLNIVEDVIKAVGVLIRVLARMYSVVRPVIVGIITVFLNLFGVITQGAAVAFGWVPGLGPKLRTAADKFAAFKNSVNAQLAKIDDVDVTIRIRQVFTTIGQQLVSIGKILNQRAAGGITGAASGGIRNGLTWVGEHGPELVDIPSGSRVHSNPDSMRLAAGQQDRGQPLLVQLLLDGKVLAAQLLDPQREMVSKRYGGSVQAAYGRAF